MFVNAEELDARPRPQESCFDTSIEPDSFYGNLRSLYGNAVLKTQLGHLKKQGSYDAFKMQWHPSYDDRRLHGGMTRSDAQPPSLFWESDIGKWIEGACYFLASGDAQMCQYKTEFDIAIQELVDMMESAQQDDGYLNVYFTVVDPEGRFKNLRDMHEMYNAGHLLEGALAHYRYTGSRQFLDIMIKNIECFMRTFGPEDGQLHGYPGHPELELAVIRLYNVTKDRRHLEFARYLLEARGVARDDQNGECYFVYEAQQRNDFVVSGHMRNIRDLTIHQAHQPLHDQETILGHAVRAQYLITAAADLGGSFLEDARRLWLDCVDHKMYPTGGIGSVPRIEGFSPLPYSLPQSTAEGGCYAETCAAIGLMMTSERLLSYQLDGKARDIMELCLLNSVLGGGSLDGTQFSYANKHATCGDETATRKDWFEVCCCPPNLSRTLGMIGGYTWSCVVDKDAHIIHHATATIKMRTGMPWKGNTRWELDAPSGWSWDLSVPQPEYAEDIKTSCSFVENNGFLKAKIDSTAVVTMDFSMPVRLLAPHPRTGQDTLTVTRGPIVYTAESFDNPSIDQAYPHFGCVGLSSSTTFEEVQESISGIPVIMLRSVQRPLAMDEASTTKAYRVVRPSKPARAWTELNDPLVMVPWFARANRGGAGRLRTSFIRVF